MKSSPRPTASFEAQRTDADQSQASTVFGICRAVHSPARKRSESHPPHPAGLCSQSSAEPRRSRRSCRPARRRRFRRRRLESTSSIAPPTITSLLQSSRSSSCQHTPPQASSPCRHGRVEGGVRAFERLKIRCWRKSPNSGRTASRRCNPECRRRRSRTTSFRAGTSRDLRSSVRSCRRRGRSHASTPFSRWSCWSGCLIGGP